MSKGVATSFLLGSVYAGQKMDADCKIFAIFVSKYTYSNEKVFNHIDFGSLGCGLWLKEKSIYQHYET